MAQDTGRNGRPGQQRTGGSRPGNAGQSSQRAGWSGRIHGGLGSGRGTGPGTGGGAPVFKEITWLRRWPRLVSTSFIVLILLEIMAFLWVAEHIGLALTLLVLIGSAVTGLWLIRRTGLDMVGKLRLTLAQGQEPGHSLVDGACFVIAGLLLIVPGFFTDIAALLLMLPVTRNWLIRRFAGKIVGGDFATANAGAGKGKIITDVEFSEVTEPTVEPAPAPAATGESAQPAAEEAAPVAPRFEPEIITPAKAEPRPAETSTVEATDDDPAGVVEPVQKPEPKPEDERWGRAPRRPIIDIEES